MKKYNLTANLGLKISALIIAFFLWVVVVNIDEPVEVATFRGIPVSVQNPEIVTQQGKIYKVVDDTQTVTVIVKAKRKDLSKITADKINAVADMQEMQLNSLVPIKISIPGYEGHYTAEALPGNLHVKIEERKKKVFPLKVMVIGTPRDGYVIDEESLISNPEKVEAKGAESLIENIDMVVAKVDVSGLSKSAELPAELVYYDSHGNPIDRNQLTDNVGNDGITVNVTVLNTKSVGVRFELDTQPEEGYAVSKITYEPEKIQVCGVKEVLDNISEIVIPGSELDITGLTEKTEKAINISAFLPEGIRLMDKTISSAVVTVFIEQEGLRTIEYQLESIQIKNLQDGLTATFESGSDLALQFRGMQEHLDAINIVNAVSIDLKEVTKPGTYEVGIKVDLGEASGVTLVDQPKVKVVVSEKKDIPADAS